MPFTSVIAIFLSLINLALLALLFIRTQKQNSDNQTNLASRFNSEIPREHMNPRFIQKVGIVRFNPYNDMGGDQSFALAVLDGLRNGVVISSLCSRSGTRIYAKTVMNGDGLDHPLSQEEQEAINKAMEE